ncbi:hypothetical protein [Oricola sp.]|uniref:hypothetical protein n=1 Tax=Oricola sp. TaxID=1979950 RepID=UPI003BAB15B6
MKRAELAEKLQDERCGLFFLAGLDDDGRGGKLLTIHAAQGLLNSDQECYLRSAAVTVDPALDVRVVRHTKKALNAPKSLESFVRRFQSRTILLDPTGVFDRASRLLRLVLSMDKSQRQAFTSVLWQADESALLFVKSAGVTDDEYVDALLVPVRTAIANESDDCLSRAVLSVRAVSSVPAGTYTPVDDLSAVAGRTGTGLLKSAVRALTAAAALIGVGSATLAHASLPNDKTDRFTFTPGIEAISGLTTLGENAFGARNHFRAVGGLRLYFGDSELFLASLPRSGLESDVFDEVPSGDLGEDSSEGADDGKVGPPLRLAY